jgi:ribosomal protein S15P/S13E
MPEYTNESAITEEEGKTEVEESAKTTSHLITVSLKAHPDLEKQVTDYATQTGLKKAEIVRRALIRYMADPNVQEQARLARDNAAQADQTNV